MSQELSQIAAKSGKSLYSSTHKNQMNIIEEPVDELFGIWKNREDMGNVRQYVRNMRKGKNYDY